MKKLKMEEKISLNYSRKKISNDKYHALILSDNYLYFLTSGLSYLGGKAS